MKQSQTENSSMECVENFQERYFCFQNGQQNNLLCFYSRSLYLLDLIQSVVLMTYRKTFKSSSVLVYIQCLFFQFILVTIFYTSDYSFYFGRLTANFEILFSVSLKSWIYYYLGFQKLSFYSHTFIYCLIQLFSILPFCLQKLSLSGGMNMTVYYFIYVIFIRYSLDSLVSDQIQAVLYILNCMLQCSIEQLWAALVKLVQALFLFMDYFSHEFKAYQTISVTTKQFQLVIIKLILVFGDWGYSQFTTLLFFIDELAFLGLKHFLDWAYLYRLFNFNQFALLMFLSLVGPTALFHGLIQKQLYNCDIQNQY